METRPTEKQIAETLRKYKGHELSDIFLLLLDEAAEQSLMVALSEFHLEDGKNRVLPPELRQYYAGYAAGLRDHKRSLELWMEPGPEST